MPDSLVLVASANPASWHRIKDALRDRFAVTFAVDLQGVVDVLAKHRPPLLVLSSRLLNAGLDEAAQRLTSHLSGTRVIAITASNESRTTKAALAPWVDACLDEQWVSTALLPLAESLLSSEAAERPARREPAPSADAEPSEALAGHPGYRPMVLGSSPAMRALMETIRRIAPTDVSVLITGESGTGKELLARWIHLLSPRARGPFEAVNLSAVPRELFESILFGHERGSFTGATAQHLGKFLRARQGTLFLDEVSSLRLELQPKLLRAIQEREVETVGGREAVACDARIVAATNTSLAEAVRRGEFRADLYYRLEVVPLHLPPLRERTEDIPDLLRFFLSKYASQFSLPPPAIAPELIPALQRHDWPGNCRELENRVQRAILLAKGGALQPEDLLGARASEVDAGCEEGINFGSCSLSLSEMDQLYIQQVLRHTDGNFTQAAQVLKIDRKTLRAKMQRTPAAALLRSVP